MQEQHSIFSLYTRYNARPFKPIGRITKIDVIQKSSEMIPLSTNIIVVLTTQWPMA